jgi:hypothetical protein
LTSLIKKPDRKIGFLLEERNGGERGIRTLGRGFPLHTLSRRAPSADSAISPFGLYAKKPLWFIKRKHLRPVFLAEGVGFEPTELLHSTVFKTAALNHSAIPPFSNRCCLPFHCFRVNDFILLFSNCQTDEPAGSLSKTSRSFSTLASTRLPSGISPFRISMDSGFSRYF